MSDPSVDPPGSDTPPPPKARPETLTLRAAPRRIVRFKRGVVIGGAAAGALAIAGVAWMALGTSAIRIADQADDRATAIRPSPADAVAELPGDYGAVPPLGPPLPGDLGRAVLDRQRQLEAEGGPSQESPATAMTPQEQAAEAERQRLAAQVHQAREAGVIAQSAARTPAPIAPAADAMAGPTQMPPSPSEAGPRLTLDPERDPNHQQRKLDVLGQRTGDDIYNGHGLQAPISPYQVMAGSVIAASLITGLNSDLPGLVTAQVTENVYDTVTGRTVLIPQGSRLIGSYNSVVAFGQSRALLIWQRIVLPDGSSIQIDNLPATDAAGYAGLQDRVDYHTWRLLKGVGLATLLGIGTELTLDDESDLVRAVRESSQQSASQAGQQIVTRNLNLQPTIRVRPGWPLRVIVHKDLVLRPWAA
ncbi:TrbI/VirB10 family protein [Hephaestia sp. GCM10023244]|uniref:TrbI/VirB10 family protein n=1 Tax=unclassified Hephaestia TaxID=2631281 RepID=UPI00207775B5|nr:TrbI/VirB10 family protein [Hephaestia sp. MAHUQ-44]MCM8731966.1 conjugal transfer protein TrbI [Hephaestia sp. MAHUQ-44]